MNHDDQVVLKFPDPPPEQNFLEIDPDRLETFSATEVENEDSTDIDTTLRMAGLKRPYWQDVFG